MEKTSISIGQLHDTDKYVPIDVVNYNDLLPFLIKYIKPHSIVMKLFFLINILFLVIIGLMVVNNFMCHYISILSLVNYFGLAGFITILSIPVHELLHGLAFKMLGAGKLTFGANLRQFMFYVTSHQFVMNKKQFYFLALTPFVVVSSICIYFLLHPSFSVRWVSANVLFAHATCCIGDFGLMSYFQIRCRHRKGFTYDDVPSMTSFFFHEKE